jgi:hypothetical protein
MEEIGKAAIWSFLEGAADAAKVENSAVRQDLGFLVRDYLDLANRVAELQFLNREYVLLFRGQPRDYLNQDGASSLRPTLLRASNGLSRSPDSSVLTQRFDILRRAEMYLVQQFISRQLKGLKRVQRQRILRWAILQHYDCTPSALVGQNC